MFCFLYIYYIRKPSKNHNFHLNSFLMYWILNCDLLIGVRDSLTFEKKNQFTDSNNIKHRSTMASNTHEDGQSVISKVIYNKYILC